MRILRPFGSVLSEVDMAWRCAGVFLDCKKVCVNLEGTLDRLVPRDWIYGGFDKSLRFKIMKTWDSSGGMRERGNPK